MEINELERKVEKIEASLIKEVTRVETECKNTFERQRRINDSLESRVYAAEKIQLSCPVSKEVVELYKSIQNMRGKIFYWYVLIGVFMAIVSTLLGFHVKETTQSTKVSLSVEKRLDRLEVNIQKLLDK